MLVKMIHELRDAVIHPARDGQVIPHRQVLHQLAQPHAARVRAYRDAELRGHEDHREVLVHAAQPAAVDLAEPDGVGLEELFEQHAVGAVLAGGDADRGDGARNRRVAKHVVWTRRLLDPEQVEARERLHVADRFVDVPALVGVDHQLAAGTDRFAHQREPARVVGRVGADLDLEVCEAVRERFAAQPPHFLV
jgi:hypothetical protein